MKRRTNLIAISAGVVLALGIWTAAGAQGNVARGTMTLSMSGGTCNKTLSGNDGGSRIRAKRGGTVEWTVINNCTADATVALGDWVVKGDGSANDPFDPSGKPSCTAAPGKQCVIALHVKANAGVTTYSYSTSVNGAKKDPDLVIET